ncbi:adenylyl-sulfate kinase [Variovorax paradoxus]|uniref:Adenylyl-sulfate kinase n=2 Tax=Variovorax paradoxus TaxID=34073 RepID=A0AAW8EKD8_VARPD|nr:adenylyl-sulfate kinase [Variovorax paradoxus]MBW8717391.1 adenylyl-sulfate kinase [Variovorax paradoxus]MDP9973681.1 adenylylsulfate kinase [Variovorax paradoxus]
MPEQLQKPDDRPASTTTLRPPPVIWLTGLSGAGKSTIAAALQPLLRARGVGAVRLDGDEVRKGLNHGLGFSAEDRHENIRRIAHIARLLNEQGMVAIVAVVSPLQALRDLARSIVGPSYHEVFVHAPLEVCERRDPKGMYARARQGAIARFTGVSDIFEAPANPALTVDTSSCDVSAAVQQIMASLEGTAPTRTLHQ